MNTNSASYQAGYEAGYDAFESSATIVFTPYSFSQNTTYYEYGTNTLSVDMRADLGSGYANYTSDHFSNFSVSSVYVSGDCPNYASGLYMYNYESHTYTPSTGMLNVKVYGHTGNHDLTSTVKMTVNFTIIHLEQ